MSDITEKRWKNQYIDLISERRDRIFAAAKPADLSHTRAQIENLRPAYDECIWELGSGSGGHIIEHAQKAPRTLFIGVELRYKRAWRTIEKAEKYGINNLYMIQGDARAIESLLEDGQLHGLYVNFPDPWAKKRWLKHRLISTPFLEVLARKLAPGGFFSHKTDHPNYFDSSLEALRNVKSLSPEFETRDLHSTDRGADLVKSEFEKLFISQGLPVHYVLARKV